MTSESDRWYDDAAGPVVRPYAMTRGRTSNAAETKIDELKETIALRRSIRPRLRL